jgi:hypothetical protein
VSSKGLAALLGVLDLAMIEAIPKGMKVYDRSIGADAVSDPVPIMLNALNPQ